jgi:hypothetical protein
MLRFLPLYFSWHYGRALADFGGVLGNLWWFVGHLFSLPLMIRSLFSPWRRLNEAYPRSFMSLEAIGEALVVNILMRMVGFVARVVLISIALLSYGLLLVGGALTFSVWLAVPVLIPALLIYSFPFLI